MKKGSTLFLKSVLLLISILILAGLLWFPHLEGRNVSANFFQIYFQDGFLAYVYFSSIPFFLAFYQAFKLLELIEKNKAFTQKAVNCLRNIKYCALALSGLILPVIPLILNFAHDDDSPGVMLIVLIFIFASLVVATAAAVFQSLLQNAVDIKSENDLTV